MEGVIPRLSTVVGWGVWVGRLTRPPGVVHYPPANSGSPARGSKCTGVGWTLQPHEVLGAVTGGQKPTGNCDIKIIPSTLLAPPLAYKRVKQKLCTSLTGW